MTKVLTIVGTRPEIIRLSRVMAALDKFCEHKIVHTGQNYDYELNEVFFEELGVRKPDHFLGVDTNSLGQVLGNILIKIETVLVKEEPDAVLILGDTNSAIAGIMVKRLKIPLYHMEAGNRCFDPNVPEELNRKIIDRISDFNLVYTEHARRHLLAEGLPHRRTYLTGSPMNEVLSHYREQIERSPILSELKLETRKYFLASIHREENVDSSENLSQLLQSFNNLIEDHDLDVIVSTHPRTRKRLDKLADQGVSSRVHFLKPFGFFAYNQLQKNAKCVLSDSGTITEESALLGFPAVTVRKAIERPEGMDTGSIIMTGLDPEVIRSAVALAIAYHNNGQRAPVPADYQIENVSERVVKLIVGTAKVSNEWDGIEHNDLNRN